MSDEQSSAPALSLGFPLPAHAPLLLDDPACAWRVTAGEVTLFAMRVPRGPSLEGPRHYIGTLPTGSILCGLGTDDVGTTLIAIGMAEAVLQPIDLQVTPATAEESARLADGLSLWARVLGTGLARPMMPKPRLDIAIASGQGPSDFATAATVGARGQPVWARLQHGPWLFLGLEAIEGLVPLPNEAWLTVQQGTIEAVPAQEAVSDPGLHAGILSYNAACLAVLPSTLALDAADELTRLKLRQDRDAEATAEQQASYAAILGNTVPTQKTGDADPLMPVFRVIANHLGVRPRRPIRARRADVDAVPSLDELARATGLRIRPVQLTAGWSQQDNGALFAQMDKATVALIRRSGRYHVFTAEAPEGVPLTPDRARLVERDAQTVFLPLPRKPLGLGDLMASGMQGAQSDVLAVIALMLIGAGLGQMVPIATGVAFSLLIPGGHASELTQLGAALVLVAAVAWMVRLSTEVARQRIEARAGPALHAAIWDRVIRLPLAMLGRQTTGETAGRAGSAVSLAVQLRASAYVLATAIAMILSSAVLMLVTQPTAAAIAVALLVLQLGFANLAGWLQARAFATGEALSGLADAMVFQIVSGLLKLRLAGAEERAQSVWAGRFAEMRRRLTSARRISNGYDAFAAGFTVLATAGCFLMIALMQRVEPGQPPPSLASVMSFISAYGLMVGASTQLAKTIFALWFLMPTRKFAQPLLDTLPEMDAGRVDPGRMNGAIELSSVTFRYGPNDPWVLSGLTLRIEPGEYVAIVGRSGSGKSTLVRLLLGLDEASSGAIYLDGHDIRGLDLAVVRRQVATVLQAGRLPPGSIRDAVRGMTTATDDEVWQALDRAAVGADIRAMPMGLETVLTDASRVLSGGQAQRLLLARALMQKPATLILDEATSALDNVTQRATMRAIRTLPATRIVIAHRLSTIRNADRIIVLDGGRIAEMGTFDQLLQRRGGIFARQFAEEARWQAASRAVQSPAR